MADDEQFSLCWNNFNSNLSAGFHESLCRGDLVDVTLAAEGQLVKAHRLVLSVCSPYFRKMFTQMPANQHAFVFLKDVSHAALKDLIQFMYCGEVNVKQDALPAFISTAEALQIKGLTETGDSTPAPQQTHHQPAPPSPVKEMPPLVASTPITLVHQSPRQPTHRVVQQRQRQQTYKTLDSEGSSDEKVIIHQMSQKRPAPKILSPASAPAIKRVKQQQQIQQIAQTATKSTADPLESSAPIQIITSQSITASSSVHPEPKSIAGDTEFIDLPDETINPKTEPEFEEQDDDQADQHEQLQHEIEQESENDQDQQYAEDNNSTYGSIKYDESYFATEEASGGEVKAGVSTMSISGVNESYATEGGEPSTTEAQGPDNSKPVKAQPQQQQQSKHRLKTQKLASNKKFVTHELRFEGIGTNRVPLHKGSNVFITESELRSITTLKAKAGLYISRLADIIFGREAFEQAVNSNEINLDMFDQEKLKAITDHVGEVFVDDKSLTDGKVKSFLLNKLVRLKDKKRAH